MLLKKQFNKSTFIPTDTPEQERYIAAEIADIIALLVIPKKDFKAFIKGQPPERQGKLIHSNDMLRLILTKFSRKVSFQFIQESQGIRALLDIVYLIRNDMFLSYFTPKRKRIKGQREERKKAKKANIDSLLNKVKTKCDIDIPGEGEKAAPENEEEKVLDEQAAELAAAAAVVDANKDSPKCALITSLLNYEPPSDSD